METIQLVNVTRTYTVDDKDHHALNGVSLSFPEKGLFGIVGKSGSGKSTLLNMISLLDKPSEGTVYFCGEDINKWKDKRKIEYRNKDLGIVFQSYHLIESETVLYNIALPYLISGKNEKEGKRKAEILLNSINYKKELYNQKIFNLSGGEKERVAILRALINDPKLILADEPTGALDSANSTLIMDILKKISANRLVIVVSHNMELITHYADKIIEIKDGSIVMHKEVIKPKRGRKKKNEK